MIPVIKLEVEGMKYAIKTALTQHQAAMDKAVNQALEQICSEENIKYIVESEARRVLEQVIQEEVVKFFRYGEGRQAVAESVKETILKKKTFSPLDEV